MTNRWKSWRLPQPNDGIVGGMRRAADGAWVPESGESGRTACPPPSARTIHQHVVGVALLLAAPNLWSAQLSASGNVWPDWACMWFDRYLALCEAASERDHVRGTESHARLLRSLFAAWSPGAELPLDIVEAAQLFLRVAGIPEPPGGYRTLADGEIPPNIDQAIESFANSATAASDSEGRR